MKLSELTGGGSMREECDWTLPYPRSDLAEPPITIEEARAAETANCRRHRGLIATSPLPSDVHGRVYFCGSGRQYWRHDSHSGGMYAPLRFPKVGG
jgi:hypothetical protein